MTRTPSLAHRWLFLFGNHTRPEAVEKTLASMQAIKQSVMEQ